MNSDHKMRRLYENLFILVLLMAWPVAGFASRIFPPLVHAIGWIGFGGWLLAAFLLGRRWAYGYSLLTCLVVGLIIAGLTYSTSSPNGDMPPKYIAVLLGVCSFLALWLSATCGKLSIQMPKWFSKLNN